jgi:adenosylcobinamide-phosphate synthase
MRVAKPAIAIAAGFVLDRCVGEPPVVIHPVVGFGRLMTRVEKAIYQDNRVAGSAMCGIGVAVAAGTGRAANKLLGRSAATTLSVFVSVASKMLADEANAVSKELERGDLGEARQRVISLVGRKTSELNENEISRAVVESLAENTVDAVIASLWWAALGGAPMVLAHRAVNTLDAMVGHHSFRYEHFGWASAKLDDIANWIPARIAAFAVAVVRPGSAARILSTVKSDAHQHPSPNGGVIEAAFAGALNVQLGGTNHYGDQVEERGLLGGGRPVEVADIARAVKLARDISILSTLTIPVSVSFGRWLFRKLQTT